jgi:ribosomal protein L37E
MYNVLMHERHRQEAIAQLDEALARKTVVAECQRCGAKRLVWDEASVAAVVGGADDVTARPPGNSLTRMCTRCGHLDFYDVSILLG